MRSRATRPRSSRVSDTVIVSFDSRATARDGKPYENTYVWFLTMRENTIVKAVAFTIEFNEFWKRVTPVANP